MLTKIKEFAISTNFTSALKAAIAAAIPAIVFSYYGYLDAGLTAALGAIFTFPSDIPSNLKHKVNGLLVTVFILFLSNLLINLTYPYPVLLYPTFAILVFCLSMISVYGQRATMVAFSALLTISISFSHTYSGVEMMLHTGYFLIGGLFYSLVSILFFYINPHRYTELQIVEATKLTAKYLKLRGELWKIDSDRKEITRKQLLLQVELNTIHENIREMLVRNRTNYGSSNQNRKLLLYFITLVEIMELAVSTSFDHNKLHQKFDNYPNILSTYQNLAYNLAKNLKSLSKKIRDRKDYVAKHNLIANLLEFENAISEYEKSLDATQNTEDVFVLTNMLHYAEKQVEKIKTLEHTFATKTRLRDLKGRDKDLEKLVTGNYYPLSSLVENLNFSSPVFRHSLRITITLLIGLVIRDVLPFENVYWILLTVVVIMRPGYGLTKERTLSRFLGTIIGGVIGFAILALLQPNNFILGGLSIFFLVLGLTYSPSNYKIATIFITLHVVLIFTILTPADESIILYRILDTVVGAVLAILANYFLWPYWEFLSINQNIENTITANRDYLQRIIILYNDKNEVNTSYRLARNQAFIKVGDLMSSFQRMLQEPKSKQNNVQQVYKLTALNNAFLSASASLGTYSQSHKTTRASESFHIVVDRIIKNLDYSIVILKNEDDQFNIESIIDSNLNDSFSELKKIKERIEKHDDTEPNDDYKLKLQETQLVIEQLIWLTNLSENILKSTKILMSKQKQLLKAKSFSESDNPVKVS
jgi:uncharacterized membrane protein (TIGR01666 family)